MGDCGSVHQIPTIWSVSPEHLYCEGAPRARARARSRLVLPFPDPSQVGSKGMNGLENQGQYGVQTTMPDIVFCRLWGLLRLQVTVGANRMQPGTPAVA